MCDVEVAQLGEQSTFTNFCGSNPSSARFLFPFPLGIQKNFFSKSCLEFQCSHLYVNIFFVSLITKKWLFAKSHHSKSSILLSKFGLTEGVIFNSENADIGKYLRWAKKIPKFFSA